LNLVKKTLAAVLEPVDDEILVMQLGKRVLFLSGTKLTSRDEEGNEDLSMFLQNALNTLYNRLSSNIVIITCLSRESMATYLIISSKDREACMYERDVAIGVIEALSNGVIRASRIRSTELMRALVNCVSGKTNSLIRTIFVDNNENCVLHLHRIGITYSAQSIDISEIDELSSVFSRGKIRIGRVIGAEHLVAALTDDHIFRHIAIVGTTGSGKSTTASVIATEAARNGYAVLIIDWHGEYAELLSHVNDVGIIYSNPLKGRMPKYMNFDDVISRDPLAFIEILEAGLELTPAQVHVLEEALNIVRSRKIRGYIIDLIVDIVQSSSASARWYAESREALIRKLKPLTSQYLSIKWNSCEFLDLRNGSILVFDVSSISNIRVRKVLSSLLIRSLGLSAQYGLVPRPIVVIVDEAHNIFERNNPVCSLIAEVRKWRVGFVVISQAPSMLSPIVIKNTNTKIVHALKSSQDISAVLANVVSTQKMVKEISMLRPGEAYISIPEIAKPIKIRVDVSLLSTISG